MKQQLLSFHGKQEIKDMYVARVKAHQLADEITQGYYWQNGKGCAVGCTIHGSSHGLYETELGIPRIIAKLQDRIFEGLTNAEAKLFPLQFLEAIPVGVNLDNVWRQLMIWLLVDEAEGVIKHARTDAAKKAIQDVAELFKRSLDQDVDAAEFIKAKNAAYAAAAYAAAAAAAAAADAAAAAAAAAARQRKFSIIKSKLLQLLSEA